MRYFIIIVCGILAFSILAKRAWADKVLVIESYHSEFAWDAGYLRGLSSVLAPEYEIRTFELDTKRIPAEQFPQKAAAALELFAKYKPDLVVLADDNANRLLAKDILASGIPLVYLGLNNNPREYGLYGHAHVAGLMERPLLLRSVNIARKISSVPLRKVLFLFDASPTSTLIGNEVFGGGRSVDLAGVQADWMQVTTEEEWLHVARSVADMHYDLVFVGLWQRLTDSLGYSVDSGTVLAKTVQLLHVPSMGLWDFSIGAGKLAAGLVHVGEYQGRAAGEIALKLLAGERQVQIPLVVEEGVFMYSRSEAARQGFVIPASLQDTAIVLE